MADVTGPVGWSVLARLDRLDPPLAAPVSSGMTSFRSYLRRHHVGLLALLLILSGGVSYAAGARPKNSVKSAQIKNNAVKGRRPEGLLDHRGATVARTASSRARTWATARSGVAPGPGSVDEVDVVYISSSDGTVTLFDEAVHRDDHLRRSRARRTTPSTPSRRPDFRRPGPARTGSSCSTRPARPWTPPAPRCRDGLPPNNTGMPTGAPAWGCRSASATSCSRSPRTKDVYADITISYCRAGRGLHRQPAGCRCHSIGQAWQTERGLHRRRVSPPRKAWLTGRSSAVHRPSLRSDTCQTLPRPASPPTSVRSSSGSRPPTTSATSPGSDEAYVAADGVLLRRGVASPVQRAAAQRRGRALGLLARRDRGLRPAARPRGRGAPRRTRPRRRAGSTSRSRASRWTPSSNLETRAAATEVMHEVYRSFVDKPGARAAFSELLTRIADHDGAAPLPLHRRQGPHRLGVRAAAARRRRRRRDDPGRLPAHQRLLLRHPREVPRPGRGAPRRRQGRRLRAGHGRRRRLPADGLRHRRPRRTAAWTPTCATASGSTTRRWPDCRASCAHDRRATGRSRGVRSASSWPSRPPSCWRWRRSTDRTATSSTSSRPAAARLGLPGPAVVHAVPRAARDRGRAAPPRGAAAAGAPGGGRDRAARRAVRAAARRGARRPGAHRGRGGRLGASTMALGHRLSTATFDTLAWTAVLVLATQAVLDHRPRLWLVGRRRRRVRPQQQARGRVPAARRSSVACPLDPELRPELRTPWPWLAGCIAALMWVPEPGLAGPPRLAGLRPVRRHRRRVRRPRRPARAASAEAAIMFSPLIFVRLGRRAGAAAPAARVAPRPACRPLVFLVVTLVFLVTGGKGYYLAGAIVPLVAAGCTWVARSRGTRAGRGRRRARAVGRRRLAGAGAGAARRRRTPTRSTATIDDDQPETIGWPTYAAQVRDVVARPPRGAGRLHRQLRRGRRLRVVRRRGRGLQRPQRLALLGTGRTTRRPVVVV